MKKQSDIIINPHLVHQPYTVFRNMLMRGKVHDAGLMKNQKVNAKAKKPKNYSTKKVVIPRSGKLSFGQKIKLERQIHRTGLFG